MVLHIRPMFYNDIDFALRLTSIEGWTSTKRDFEELLDYDPKGCYIGEIDDEPIGMVCSVSYGSFGFIGNLIVIDSCRGQDCGKKLMEHSMNYLQSKGARSILIDAVPKALTLYERLGFRKVYRSLRLEGTSEDHVLLESEDNIRLMTKDDLQEVAELDASLFGGRRNHFLQMRYEAYPDLSRLIEGDGELQGFVMGSRCGSIIRLGPWTMMQPRSYAESLLLDFVQSSVGCTIRIGVLENNIHALELLQQIGFKEVSFSWRMVAGEDTEATLSRGLYAIYSPDRG